MKIRHLYRIWLAEARYELLRVLRTPAYSIPSILLPQLFFVLFGIVLSKPSGGVQTVAYPLVSYSAFGMLSAALVGVAASIAVERERGFYLLKRALPIPAGAYLGAKALSAMVISGITFLIMALIARVAGGVDLSPTQWPALLILNMLGVLPFAALGLFIGSAVSAAAAPGVTNLIYLPMSFLSGLWIPLRFLPQPLQTIAHYLPAYHFQQLPLTVIGAADRAGAGAHIAVLTLFAAVFYRLAQRRLDAGNGGHRAGSRWRKLLSGAA